MLHISQMPIPRRYKVATIKYLERNLRVPTFAGVHENRCELDLLKQSIHTVLAGGFWVSRATVTDFVALIRESASGMRVKMADAKIEPGDIAAGSATAQIKSDAEIARLGLTRREMQVIGALIDG